jgi:hypothetical protein
MAHPGQILTDQIMNRRLIHTNLRLPRYAGVILLVISVPGLSGSDLSSGSEDSFCRVVLLHIGHLTVERPFLCGD